MRRCVILARVSTKEKGQDATTQVDMVRGAIQRQGWVESAPPIVLKFSGWSEEESKVVIEAALAVIERGEADTLCVWKLDRVLRRGIRATLDFFDRLEKHLGGTFYSLTEPMLSTATLAPAFREFMLSLFATLARQESDQKSDRVNAKKETKRNRAAALGQRASWGRGVMARPDEEEQVVQLAAGGRSVRAIAKATAISKSQVSRIIERRRGDIENLARAVPLEPSAPAEVRE